MTNRYYVVNLTTASATRKQAIRDRLTDGGVRQRPEQLLHWRRARGEAAWLIQAEVTDTEHAFLTSGPRAAYVTYIGDYDPVTHRPDPAVREYLLANADLWDNLRDDGA